MLHRSTRCQFLAWALLAIVTLLQTNPASAQWPQWGGPDRNFSVEITGLAETWPDGGPKKLWTRPLGDGYSTIVADDGVLYTMYRNDADEFTIAMNAKTGETIWEHKVAAPVTDDRKGYGPGPYATPLLVGNRLITVGTNSVLH